ncbi:MAG: citryl-CoA lyase [Candidatus Puniceispirillaceae bacterium]
MSDVSDWWTTSIIDMEPGRIEIRGQAIQNLIGHLSFAEMIWLMLRGDTPGKGQAELLEAALVASVDHGPQAPSIAAARMAVTCGLGLNGAMGTAVHMLDDVHGGAGQQFVVMLQKLANQPEWDKQRLAEYLAIYRQDINPYIPGFGHRFHKPVDPRSPRLMELVARARNENIVAGQFMDIALRIEATLAEMKGKPVPMNIDGATAVIYAELGFAPEQARGLFCLSRSVGAMAHGYEQMQQGGRNKGPTPPQYRWRYKPE